MPDKNPIGDQYIWSATGKRIYLNNPKVQDFYLEDIAVGLSRISRFNGQIKPTVPFYSVAEHSVGVATLAIEDLFQYGKFTISEGERAELVHSLFHDGSEFGLGDITKPIKIGKEFRKAYEPMEHGFMTCIAKRFKFPYNKRARARIKVFDRIMEQTEISTIVSLPQDENYKITVNIRPDLIRGLLPNEAYEAFLDKYWEIMKL